MPLYRNTAIRRYRIGRFEFNNHLLRIRDDEVEEFTALYSQLPAIMTQNIVEIDEDAAAALVRPVQAQRGSVGAADLPSQQLIRDSALATAQMQAGAVKPVDPSTPVANVADLSQTKSTKPGDKLQ